MDMNMYDDRLWLNLCKLLASLRSVMTGFVGLTAVDASAPIAHIIRVSALTAATSIVFFFTNFYECTGLMNIKSGTV